MHIQFLGTSAMVPTAERNHSSLLLFHEKDSILFDCGEGTQKQMKIAGIDINRISRILISHWHGDHVLGLGGLLQTMASQSYDRTLKIYGPKGSKSYIENMLKSFAFDNKIDLEVNEITEGRFYENSDYYLEAAKLEHSVPTFAFAFVEQDRRKIDLDYIKKMGIPEGPLLGKLQQGEDIKFKGKTVKADDATTLVKGKKFCYIADTLPCNSAVKLAKDSDLLVSESTHASNIEEKAEEFKHLTARQAATIASQANAKKLVLTHFSQRYKDTSELEEEAKLVFPNTTCAKDFMKVKF